MSIFFIRRSLKRTKLAGQRMGRIWAIASKREPANVEKLKYWLCGDVTLLKPLRRRGNC